MRFTNTVAGRWVLAVVAFLVASSGMLLAQGAVLGSDPVAVVTAPELTSVGAVLGGTIFLTMLAKKALADTPFLGNLPIWIYVCVFAIGLTYLGNRVLGTLQGDFWLLCWQAVYNGMAASGLREWVYSGVKPMAQAAGGGGGS